MNLTLRLAAAVAAAGLLTAGCGGTTGSAVGLTIGGVPRLSPGLGPGPGPGHLGSRPGAVRL